MSGIHRQPDASLIKPLPHDRQVRFQVGVAELLSGLQSDASLRNLVGSPGGQQALGCPILDGPLHRLLVGLVAKTALYHEVLDRIQHAINESFFCEACWLQYAIIEDRVNSVIRHAHPKKGAEAVKSMRGLDTKIEHITKRIHGQDEGCRTTVNKDLIKRLTKWKNKRNALMHDLVDVSDFGKVQQKMKVLADDGVVLVNELCSRVAKYKDKKGKSA